MRRRAVPILVWALALSAALPATAGASTPHEQRTPSDPRYRFALASDDRGFRWAGRESVTFTNASPDPLVSVWLRLWDNGIRGCTTSLPIQVTNVVGGAPGPLAVDCSALEVDLPSPLAQGGRATLGFDLAIRVPNRNDRFGRIGSMALLGNAIPVLAIRDHAGVHLHPYSILGDSFYSVIGDFTVSLDAPASLAVPATGSVVARAAYGDRLRTTYRATRVRDFAWASGPLSEVSAATSTGVAVHAWWEAPVTPEQAAHSLRLAVRAMEFHAARYGPYPYREVDVVLTANLAFGGMEYPQLVMSNASQTIVHELAHQWWYGLVGDDQYGAPWLDEAFATYAADMFFSRPLNRCRTLHFPSPEARISNSLGYFDQYPGQYFPVVYGMGSCALHDLSGLLGPDVMTEFLHDYAVGHRFGWTTTPEFQRAAQRVADSLPNPIDLTSFWARHRIG